jgi:hypothetical protein
MTRKILGLTAMLLAAASTFAPRGQATPFPSEFFPSGTTPFNPEAELAYRVAVTYWGGEPEQCTTVTRILAPEIVNSDGSRPLGIAGDCEIAVQLGLPFVLLCDVTTHELGHLHGLGHSSDPTSVMYPEMGRIFVPGCPSANSYLQFQREAEHARERCLRMKDTVPPARKQSCWQTARWERHVAVRFGHQAGID